MRVRIPLPLRTPLTGGAVAVLALGLAVGAAPTASAAPTAPTVPTAPSAAACRPSVTVLPLPTWAVRGTVNDAVPGTAVGSVTNAQGITRAMRWQRAGNRWVVRPIVGLDGLGRVSSYATGVNRSGAISIIANPGVSFVAADGLLYPLADGTGGRRAYATDISDTGQVVGSALSAPESLQVPARWDYWTAPPRGLGRAYGYDGARAEAIDAAADIAGGSSSPPVVAGSGFRIDGDGATQTLNDILDEAGRARSVTALDLNAAERTVGRVILPSGSGAVVWDGPTPTVLPRFVGGGPYAASANAVSSSGVVVGYEDERTGSESPLVRHVLVWTDAGGVRSLLPPSGRWTDPATANAVDDAGTVYGSGYSTSLSQHPGEMVPTAWTCATQQAFVPTATGVPAAAPRPDVVVEQG